MTEKHALDGAVAYLCGAIEHASDDGIGWRRRFIDLLQKADLSIDCIDPTNKPGGECGKPIDEAKQHQIDLQKGRRWDELRDYVHSYRRLDLRFIDYSDLVVAAIAPDIPQWGSANEIYEAERQHKPLFFIVDGGLSRLPRWLFDVIDLPGPNTRGNVFETVEEVVEELKLLDRGDVPLSDKWVLIRKYIERTRVVRSRPSPS